MYDIIVLENLRFRPSTHVNEKPAFPKICTLENVFEKMHLRWQNSSNTYVWTVGQTGKSCTEANFWFYSNLELAEKHINDNFGFFQQGHQAPLTPK